jgi:hypothetical protein
VETWALLNIVNKAPIVVAVYIARNSNSQPTAASANDSPALSRRKMAYKYEIGGSNRVHRPHVKSSREDSISNKTQLASKAAAPRVIKRAADGSIVVPKIREFKEAARITCSLLAGTRLCAKAGKSRKMSGLIRKRGKL